MHAEATPLAVKENVDNVVQLERDALSDRSFPDKLADGIAGFAGTVFFVLLHLVGFAAYVAWNVGAFGLVPFDPFPFALLALVVSLEGVLLSTFVLIKQNRMGLISDRRAHLDLQVSLLAERETTRVLQLIELLAERAGIAIPADRGDDLTQRTDVLHVARALHEKLAE